MIFTRGDFNHYKSSQSLTSLNESVRRTRSFSSNTSKPYGTTTVFISHKHNDLDLEEVKGVMGMLEKEYHIIPYIDSMDDKMPGHTCAETAKRIKQVIEFCDKFILLATNSAIESYWCNWEVGIGDVHKYKNNIAIVPMQDVGKSYTGNEYLKLYSSIEYRDGTTRYSNTGEFITKGYYVRTSKEENYTIESLKTWLERKQKYKI
jgi:hypothetical protein